jgi:polyphosphate kinase 2 (PPK2 family)
VEGGDGTIEYGPDGRITGESYDRELFKLQEDLVDLQEWIKHEGLRVAVIFEGRDAAGKGGVVKHHARLNCIHHLLQTIPYQQIPDEPVELPDLQKAPDYRLPPHREFALGP